MSLLKPIKIKSTALDAPDSVTGIITSFKEFQGTSRHGDEYEEFQAHFLLEGIPHYVALNQKSMIVLAAKGFTMTREGLMEELPSIRITWKLIKADPYDFYLITKVAKRGKRKDPADNDRGSTS